MQQPFMLAGSVASLLVAMAGYLCLMGAVVCALLAAGRETAPANPFVAAPRLLGFGCGCVIGSLIWFAACGIAAVVATP